MPSRAALRRDESLWLDVSLLLLATLVVRAALFAITGNESGDPDARALWGADVHRDFRWITSGFWLPLHPYAISALMHVFGDPLSAGKVLSLVTGVLAIVPFYALVRLEFDRRTALLAGVFFALYGLHAGLSVVVMTETTFVFFAMWGLWLFVAEMRSERPRLGRLVASAALLAVAGGWRHEAWQLTGLLMLWLAIDRRTRTAVVPFALVGFSAFVLWTAGNIMAGHGPLYSLTGVASQKEKELAYVSFSAVSNIVKWIWTLVESPGPLLAGLMAVGLWLSIVRRRFPPALAWLSLLMVAPYVLLSVVKTEWRPQQRYVVFMVILLLPYAAAAFWHWAGRIRHAGVVLAALLVVTVLGQGVAFSRHASAGLPVRDYKANDVQAWTWMASNLEPGDRVVVEDLSWRSPGLILHSGRWATPHAMVMPLADPQEMADAIRLVDATVVVLSSDGSRWPVLGTMPVREVYRNDEWRVLRVERPR